MATGISQTRAAKFVGAGGHLHDHIVQQRLGRYIKFLREEYEPRPL